jgi:ArsR family transcriptional regulator
MTLLLVSRLEASAIFRRWNSQPTTSRHLKILRDRGLVAPTRAGANVIYSLTDTRLIDALDLLRAVMRDVFDHRAAAVSRVE